jgi:hypothetical protein
MARHVEQKLKRLVRLTELVYRLEAVAAGELLQSQRVLESGAQEACAVLDEVDSPSFLRELALARAARYRSTAEASRIELDLQLSVAVEALARFKGAETLAEASAEANSRGEAQRTLEDAIDGPRATRFGQGADTSGP